jgi:hypothetical protein
MPLRPAPVLLRKLLALDNSAVKTQSLTGQGLLPTFPAGYGDGPGSVVSTNTGLAIMQP